MGLRRGGKSGGSDGVPSEKKTAYMSHKLFHRAPPSPSGLDSMSLAHRAREDGVGVWLTIEIGIWR